MNTVNYEQVFSTNNLILVSVIYIFYIVVLWKIFTKAGEPGWASIVPIYNLYVLSKITMGNGWLFLIIIIPFANFIYLMIMYYKLAGVFGKSSGFGIGLIFLSIIFMNISF